MITNIFDSHAHYNDKKFAINRDQLLKSLPSNGVSKVINVGTNIEESSESVDLANRYNYIFAAVGIHPYNIQNLSSQYLQELDKMSKHSKVVAIGEIGLDYYNNTIPRDQQQKIFHQQLSLAHDLKLPVIIHTRDADKDTVDILKKYKINGVIHCFSSSYEISQQLTDMGFYLGFTGVITFKNNIKQQKTISEIPLDKILIETDCPYLAPEPHRGQICDSTMLPYIIDKISSLKNQPPQEIANITNINACKLFNIN